MIKKPLAVMEWRCLEKDCAFTSKDSVKMRTHLIEHGYADEMLEHHYDTIVVKSTES